MSKLQLTIENASRWPTMAIHTIAEWALSRERLRRRYRLLIEENVGDEDWRGEATRHAVRISVNRRLRLPQEGTFIDFAPGQSQTDGFELKSRFELLVFVMATSIRASKSMPPADPVVTMPGQYRGANYARHRQEMKAFSPIAGPDFGLWPEPWVEAGREAVEAFRKQWPHIRSRIRAARHEHQGWLQERNRARLRWWRQNTPLVDQLRRLPRGTAVKIKRPHHQFGSFRREALTVTFLQMQRTRFLAKFPNGQTYFVPADWFVDTADGRWPDFTP